MFPHERTIRDCVLSLHLLCPLGTRPCYAPSPRSRGTDAEETPQLSRISLLHRKSAFPWHPKDTGRASTQPSPARGAGPAGLRGATAFLVRSRCAALATLRSAVAAAERCCAALCTCCHPRGSRRRQPQPLSTSADPRVPPGSWKSSTTTNQVRWANFSAQGLRETQEMEI